MTKFFRKCLSTVGAIVLLSSATMSAVYADDKNNLNITLLGTGSPALDIERFSMSTLVEAGGKKFLFDAGRGVTLRLWQAKVTAGKIDGLFITHFHSDHLVGLPDFWLTGWIPLPVGGRTKPLYVYGPTGVTKIIDGLNAAFSDDIGMRIVDEGFPPEGAKIVVTEFKDPGVIYDKEGVRITAFDVPHGEKIKPSVGYRVDYKGKSVVISGDTKYSENLIAHSKGVDVLIHEVAAANSKISNNQLIRAILGHHTTPSEAAFIFKKVVPKLAVFSHLVQLGNANAPMPSPEEILAETKKSYSGDVLVGKDLTQISITDSGVNVRYFNKENQSFEP